MYSRVLKTAGRVLALAVIASMPLALAAQDAAKTQDAAKPAKAPYAGLGSKWDIFGGYSFISPHGTVDTPLENNTTTPTSPFNYVKIPGGGIFAVTRFLNKNIGIEAIGDVHVEDEHAGVFFTKTADDMSGGSIGLLYQAPKGNWTPFVHALGGGERVAGPHWQLETWGPSFTLGGGIDYTTKALNHHLAIRLIQFDYQYSHNDFGPLTLGSMTGPGAWGGVASINAARISTGLTFHVGDMAPPTPITLTAVATPAVVYPGDPVTVTATAGNVAPKLNTVYSWEGNGASGTATTTQIATGNLAPGTYTVKAGVKEGKHGKEGVKPWETAVASASFTVKQFDPPTVACAVNPSTIKPGETSAVTATGVSPQNRPLTYTYSTSAGSVSGSGSTATFASAGAPAGTVGITCTVTDDKGQTASATANLNILQPPPPPVPHTSALGAISFDKDKKRPARVDNEAKAILDGVALSLQKQPDAKAVVVGESNAKEKAAEAKQQKAALRNKHIKVEDLAAQRAVNTKDYLVTEKGIDAARVSARTGTADSQTVENYLVPAGADFNADVAGTTPVDETKVTPQARKPLAAKAHKKKAAKAGK